MTDLTNTNQLKQNDISMVRSSDIQRMPAPAHLPESMMASVGLLPENKRMILFTRHSLRERSDGNGFASSQLPLTPKGRVLAIAWGRWLENNLPYTLDVDGISSPIQRCVDTGILMQEGAGLSRGIVRQPLLVEPGSLVIEPEIASPLFKEIGALNFINRFISNDLPGTKQAHHGALDLLTLLYQSQPSKGEMLLSVSHDTLLSAFLSVMMEVEKIDWNDWPKMMEGVFVWFENARGNEIISEKNFVQSRANFIWRGRQYVRPVKELIERL